MIRLAVTRLGRNALGTALRGRALRLLARLDADDAGRAQERLLGGLVHRTRRTPFGRAHDFGRVRTPRDFRRLVPLGLPGDFDAVAPPSAAVLLGRHPRVALTALALAAQRRHGVRVFDGQVLVLGESEREGEAAPVSLRPFVTGVVVPGDAEALAAAAVSASKLRVSCVVGGAKSLGRFMPALCRASGGRHAAEIWPLLGGVLCVETAGETAPPHLVADLGEVPVLRLYANAAGPVAIEDRNLGAFRLLADHGAFFEFVPEAEWHHPEPSRLALGDVEPGVVYALAVSSASGVWACLTGERVCFESLKPPLLRFVPATAPKRDEPVRELAAPAPEVTRARRERVGAH